MSRATRAVRDSGLDHDITDTPTVDRHEQTRVERGMSPRVWKIWEGSRYVSARMLVPESLEAADLILLVVRSLFLLFPS